jgi:hypothetical protein
VPLSNAEFDAILTDCTKRIDGDIVWQQDLFYSPSLGFYCPSLWFKVELAATGVWSLLMKDAFNLLVPAISFALISKAAGAGRIYALDLGKGHRNPDGVRVGDPHKHRWSEQFKDKEAYEPIDVTAAADDPVQAWQQFCQEAKIEHQGRMHPPPPVQGDLFL